ncbi:MAG: NAD-dependent epimerase/dehydratase family protein [Leptolinea sp.]|jgi:UDP-glucose 4-epimerase|nr:NAD-dependent epimerase/dehydratase family protein [Leptolinea sp.]
MKILITGVAGFIGSNLASRLIDEGYDVVGVDNMSQGHPLNLSSFEENPAFTLRKIDIKDKEEMTRAAEGCQVIVHLAAYKIPRYSDALDTLLINSTGSENVFEAARQTGARVIAASTSDVYGKNPSVPFNELSDLMVGNPTVKRWAYAISKMFEEQLLFAYHDRFGLDFVAVRFFGGYGPNQNLTWWGGPQSVFINCALDDTEIEVHGTGQQTRSFTFISDHVDGLLGLIQHPEVNNLALNLGATKEISILGLAELIWSLVRKDEKPKIKLIPYTNFGNYEDVNRRIPDISRARDLIGFQPKVDLETGLKKTILWQIQRRKALNIPTPDLNIHYG